LRVNDRVVDGKNTLFIEEIQSDWHQAGRKKGYKTEAEKEESTKLLLPRIESLNQERSQLQRIVATGDDASPVTQNAVERLTQVNAELFQLTDRVYGLYEGVPDAPFKTSWDELTLKRAIKLASDEGYDQIAFTTGKTQADRYSLSKVIDSMNVRDISGDLRTVQLKTKSGSDFQVVVNKNGVVEGGSRFSEQYVGKPFSEVVGKDMATEIMQADKGRQFSGVELDVGGEGMKGFYDKMLPKKLEKLSKRYDAKVKKTTMDTPDGPVEIWAMQLPDELKETVSTQGQPLFQLGAGAVGTAGIMSLTGGEAEAAQ
jgi:hypothetical protein